MDVKLQVSEEELTVFPETTCDNLNLTSSLYNQEKIPTLNEHTTANFPALTCAQPTLYNNCHLAKIPERKNTTKQRRTDNKCLKLEDKRDIKAEKKSRIIAPYTQRRRRPQRHPDLKTKLYTNVYPQEQERLSLSNLAYERLAERPPPLSRFPSGSELRTIAPVTEQTFAYERLYTDTRATTSIYERPPALVPFLPSVTERPAASTEAYERPSHIAERPAYCPPVLIYAPIIITTNATF